MSRTAYCFDPAAYLPFAWLGSRQPVKNGVTFCFLKGKVVKATKSQVETPQWRQMSGTLGALDVLVYADDRKAPWGKAQVSDN